MGEAFGGFLVPKVTVFKDFKNYYFKYLKLPRFYLNSKEIFNLQPPSFFLLNQDLGKQNQAVHVASCCYVINSPHFYMMQFYRVLSSFGLKGFLIPQILTQLIMIQFLKRKTRLCLIVYQKHQHVQNCKDLSGIMILKQALRESRVPEMTHGRTRNIRQLVLCTRGSQD